MSLVIPGTQSTNQLSDNQTTGQWASGYITPDDAGINVQVAFGVRGVLTDSVTQFVAVGQSLNFTAPTNGAILTVAFASAIAGTPATVYGYFGGSNELGIIASQSGQTGVTPPVVNPVTRVVTLPSSPSDLQLVAYVPDPAGEPDVEWLLIFNATENLWDFVGGAPLVAIVPGTEGLSSTPNVLTECPTVQRLTVPPGAYDIDIGAGLAQGSSIPDNLEIGAIILPSTGMFSVGNNPVANSDQGAAVASQGPMVGVIRTGTFGGGTVALVFASGSGSSSWGERWLKMTPQYLLP